jgi:L-lactate dehydrogenase complex protein LldG
MSKREDILKKFRDNVRVRFDMPALDDIKAVTYPDPLAQFVKTSEAVGGKVVELAPAEDVNELVRRLFPDATEIASNLPEITIANRNPDTVPDAQALNGTDVGIIRGELGVAENGCVWVPQTMKERAVCFISEHLVILLPKGRIVNNMHEAYRQVGFNDSGYGTFISGPSKTADIAQVLVMGAQASRSVTIILTL